VQDGSLSQRYSSKTDDELLLIAADSQSLAEESRPTLAEELRRRNLAAPDVKATEYKVLALSELPPVRIARGVFVFLLNLANAIFGTAVLESAILPNIGFSRSVVEWETRAWFFSVTMAALLGYFTAKKWSPRSAMWVWTLPIAVFAFGVFMYSPSGDVGFWKHFIAPDCLNDRQSCRDFRTFTIPAVRSVAYSVAAWLCFRVR
jgi:hypothetical protein